MSELRQILGSLALLLARRLGERMDRTSGPIGDWMSKVRQSTLLLSPEINLAVAMVDAGSPSGPGPQPSRLTVQALRIMKICHALVPYWR
ncbi:MAG: hypothetical protein H6806_06035 [Planctomycetes bacterium]|nr:hypothetical protein [Planctomycetota bacterium]